MGVFIWDQVEPQALLCFCFYNDYPNAQTLWKKKSLSILKGSFTQILCSFYFILFIFFAIHGRHVYEMMAQNDRDVLNYLKPCTFGDRPPNFLANKSIGTQCLKGNYSRLVTAVLDPCLNLWVMSRSCLSRHC